MLSHNDLKKGVQFLFEGMPYQILDSSFVFKGRGSSIVQVRMKNLINGNVLSRSFHPGEEFEEIEIQKIMVKFIYFHRDKYIFSREDNPSFRFELSKDIIGESVKFLKPNQVLEGIEFKGKIINVSLPIKINLKVTEAPPGVKGDRAQGGTKTVTLETGAQINVPLFIESGDIIEINTEKGEYVKRVE